MLKRNSLSPAKKKTLLLKHPFSTCYRQVTRPDNEIQREAVSDADTKLWELRLGKYVGAWRGAELGLQEVCDVEPEFESSLALRAWAC